MECPNTITATVVSTDRKYISYPLALPFQGVPPTTSSPCSSQLSGLHCQLYQAHNGLLRFQMEIWEKKPQGIMCARATSTTSNGESGSAMNPSRHSTTTAMLRSGSHLVLMKVSTSSFQGTSIPRTEEPGPGTLPRSQTMISISLREFSSIVLPDP